MVLKVLIWFKFWAFDGCKFIKRDFQWSVIFKRKEKISLCKRQAKKKINESNRKDIEQIEFDRQSGWKKIEKKTI